MALRRFKYRDDATIDDYLGSLELGLVEDEVRSEQRERKGSGGAKLAGLGAEAEFSSAHGTETNVRQNAASKVEKLYRLLRAEDPRQLWEFDSLTADDWQVLDKGSLISLPIAVEVSPISAAFATAKDLAPLVTLMQSFGNLEDKTIQQMSGLSQYASSGGSERMSVIGHAEGNSSYKFLCRLNRSSLLVPFETLEGSVTLFGQIEEMIEPGERELAVEVSGMGFMNREQRRKAAKKSTDLNDGNYIVGPGAIVHVVALFK